MHKLIKSKPIMHAIIWIMIYILVVNIGDAISQQISFEHLITSLLLIVLSVILLLYLKKYNILGDYGIEIIRKHDLKITLFYIPLIVIGLIQFFAGIDKSLSFIDISLASLLMIGTGFLEEVIFRGFLFQGIYSKSGLNRAVVISGVTFGIGHIVNLLRGYQFSQVIGQIILAMAIGILLALLVAITENIVPGILFHIVFNIGGTITNQNSIFQGYLFIMIFSVALSYLIYLFYFPFRRKEDKLISH